MVVGRSGVKRVLLKRREFCEIGLWKIFGAERSGCFGEILIIFQLRVH